MSNGYHVSLSIHLGYIFMVIYWYESFYLLLDSFLFFFFAFLMCPALTFLKQSTPKGSLSLSIERTLSPRHQATTPTSNNNKEKKGFFCCKWFGNEREFLSRTRKKNKDVAKDTQHLPSSCEASEMWQARTNNAQCDVTVVVSCLKYFIKFQYQLLTTIVAAI